LSFVIDDVTSLLSREQLGRSSQMANEELPMTNEF